MKRKCKIFKIVKWILLVVLVVIVTIKDLATGEVTATGLPNSNVLYYELSEDAWLCVRPSGTEPKVKFYYGIKGVSLEDADEKSAELGKKVLAIDRLFI